MEGVTTIPAMVCTSTRTLALAAKCGHYWYCCEFGSVVRLCAAPLYVPARRRPARAYRPAARARAGECSATAPPSDGRGVAHLPVHCRHG